MKQISLMDSFMKKQKNSTAPPKDTEQKLKESSTAEKIEPEQQTPFHQKKPSFQEN